MSFIMTVVTFAAEEDVGEIVGLAVAETEGEREGVVDGPGEGEDEGNLIRFEAKRSATIIITTNTRIRKNRGRLLAIELDPSRCRI